MRLLLIAYEFPPSPSPQSLRWIYLSRELARLGHEVHVLAPDLGGRTPGLPEPAAGVVVHRTFPGPVRGLISLVRKRRERGRAAAQEQARDGTAASAVPYTLRPPRNWKQRVSEAVQAGARFVHFPDIRGEWRYWGARALPRLLAELRPDAVISSHEPATTLELGLLAKRRGFRWVADLGDPVLAGYTPPRWRRRAHRIERAVCRSADLLLLTNPAAADLMARRHGRRDGVETLPQGFDLAPTPRACAPDAFDPQRLELFYTGSFYQFRRPDALLRALRADPAIRLSVAAVTVPEDILAAARERPDQIRLLGFLPHLDVLAMQRRADVLINIANDDPSQIPGKFHEYLGAGRPVLHLRKGEDPVSAAVRDLRRGWVSDDDEASLAALLRRLADAKRRGALDDGLDLDVAPVAEVSWQRIGERLHRRLTDAFAGTAG